MSEVDGSGSRSTEGPSYRGILVSSWVHLPKRSLCTSSAFAYNESGQGAATPRMKQC